jgi:aminopeptidase N
MRTDIAQPIRLSDYRAPDWLVDTVHLDVSLHPTETRVVARLALRPNPNAPAAPIVFDGDGLTLRSLKIDGIEVAQSAFEASPDRLSIAQPPNRPFTLEIETRVDPPIARNARRKVFGASPISPTGPT